MKPGFDVRRFLASLTQGPGVYRMIDAGGKILYVGKARNLRRRVASYFGARAMAGKTANLMAETVRVEVTVTATEQEALLLEGTLIKAHLPRFNVVLRDDKSYPWIHISTEQPFPRVSFHRGARGRRGRYFGPWPDTRAVRELLVQMQKLFRVRQCTDSFFSNRTRACLQYQIHRCTGPCVGHVSAEDYRKDVEDTVLFIQGRDDAVIEALVVRMESLAKNRDYEAAARIRDRIAMIRRIQTDQAVTTGGIVNADVLGLQVGEGTACIALVTIRNGRVLGSQHFFPRMAVDADEDEIFSAFITQHYLTHQPPAEIIVPRRISDRQTLEAALSQGAGTQVRIRREVRGVRQRWLHMADQNAGQGLAVYLAAGRSWSDLWAQLERALSPGVALRRVECFDVSHTSGAETVGSCVVFGPEGPQRRDYRRYNISGVAAGDDYGALAGMLRRRYARVQRGEVPVPDLVLVDGGRGQVARALQALEEAGLADVPLIGVAKGSSRRAGEERLFRPGTRDGFQLPADSPALHLIQRIRDEAHRFAVAGHRLRRGRAQQASPLEAIPGLGPTRRRALLRQFGGLAAIRAAGIGDLARVKGISQTLARRIHEHLHGRSG